ncbi:MAG: MFS transporter [Rhizomicrobium sp.]|jgi:DHA1 family tetracycline resistance protein-like MFS transporter
MAQTSRSPLVFIFITRLLDAMGFGIIMPVIPGLLIHLGESNVAVAGKVAGYLLVTYSVLQFICGPIVGSVSDRFGRRPVILVSLFAYACDFTIMGIAPTVAWLFVGRAAAGIAGAVYVPANAYVADITTPENRAKAFGMVGSAFGIGFILGPIIGGLLGHFGLRAPFFAAAALAAANLAFGYFVLPESLPKERRRAFDWSRANVFGTIFQIARKPHVLGYAIATMIYFVANTVYPSTWAFVMTAKFNWSSLLIGVSLGATGIAMAAVQMFLVGRFVNRLGELRAALTGLMWAACSMFAFALANQTWLVFAITIVGGLQALSYPALNALMSRAMPPDEQGELQGGVASLTSLATIIGTFTMTQTFAYFARPGAAIYFPGGAFVLAALLMLIAAGVLLTQRTRTIPAPARVVAD